MKEQNIRLHIVLDNIRSAFNVGSIFRTADAVGGCKLYLCGMTATPDNPKILKTALGSQISVPSVYFKNVLDAIEEIKKHNIPVFAVELSQQSEHFQTVKYPNPVALVFGHERNGVNNLILDRADKIVSIPMKGIKESLNVANSAGIVLYEAVRGS